MLRPYANLNFIVRALLHAQSLPSLHRLWKAPSSRLRRTRGKATYRCLWEKSLVQGSSLSRSNVWPWFLRFGAANVSMIGNWRSRMSKSMPPVPVEVLSMGASRILRFLLLSTAMQQSPTSAKRFVPTKRIPLQSPMHVFFLSQSIKAESPQSR
ncbi:hypothetical protein FVE85_9440 [Porphyridium purpureum]|uniref:Uncharacterized protein n=1 Tax=Porphyridium purpureum TaxID=35688 RepID=A0A5J4YJ18_PORPP|nr:hypothetical protein FVE85_9440 [Porphyridium purpureum]|eukprot:POR6323..scf261_15